MKAALKMEYVCGALRFHLQVQLDCLLLSKKLVPSFGVRSGKMVYVLESIEII